MLVTLRGENVKKNRIWIYHNNNDSFASLVSQITFIWNKYRLCHSDYRFCFLLFSYSWSFPWALRMPVLSSPLFCFLAISLSPAIVRKFLREFRRLARRLFSLPVSSAVTCREKKKVKIVVRNFNYAPLQISTISFRNSQDAESLMWKSESETEKF